MAVILTDNFNSYTDGNLNGQGSWSGDTAFQVQGTVVQEGAKAVSCTTNDTNNFFIAKSGTLTTDGDMAFYLRASNVNFNYSQINLLNGTDSVYPIRFAAATISIFDFATPVSLTTGAIADNWYQIRVQWRNSDYKYRASLDGGTFTAWSTAQTDLSPNAVQWQCYGNGGTTTEYLDNIYDPTVTPTAKTFNFGTIIC